MATATGKVPIFKSVEAGALFWRRVVGPAAPFAVGTAAAVTPLALLGDGATLGGPIAALGWALLGLAASIAYTALLMRWAVRGEAPTGLGLKFGADEGRLLASQLVVGFAMAILAVCGGLVLLSVFTVLASGHGDLQAAARDEARLAAIFAETLRSPSGIAFLAAAFGFLGLVLWLAARLTLAAPATIARRRVMAFATFSWTRGNGLQILAVLILAALPALLALMAWAAVRAAVLPDGPEGAPLALAAVFAFGELAISNLIAAPFAAGASAFLLSGLAPEDAPAAPDGEGA